MIVIEPAGASLKGNIAIAVVPVLFAMHFLFTGSKRIRLWLNRRFGREAASVRRVLLSRLLGTFLFGFIPALLVLFLYGQPLRDFGLNTDAFRRIIPFWLVSGILIFILVYFISRRERNLALYPQIRCRVWDTGLVLLSAVSWMVYIAGYEFMFRGFLLFASFGSYGYWPAIAINVIYYALAHIHRGALETFGAVPAGLVFCYFSLQTGSLCFALLTHITLALTTEWFSLYYNPEMRVLAINRSQK